MFAGTRIIRRSDWVSVPWRNGQGVSYAIWTGEADPVGLQIFRTPITQFASFSDFTGFERILTVVNGASLRLTIDGVEHEAQLLSAVRFAGEAKVSVALPSGPAEVLNIIYERRVWREAVSEPELTIIHAVADMRELQAADTLLTSGRVLPHDGAITVPLVRSAE